MKNYKKRNFYTLGELIFLARNRKGYSREDVVKILNEEKVEIKEVSIKGEVKTQNITLKTIKKWENDLNYPDIDVIYVLARILEVDPNKLLASKQYVQKHKIDSLAMKIVGNVCYALDISPNYVGIYRKIVSDAIRIIVVLLYAKLFLIFMGY